MKHFASIIFLFIALTNSWCKELKYPTNQIPDSLKKNAHAIIRKEIVELEVHSSAKITEKTYTVITVLNENGEDYAWEYLPYDNHINLKNFELNIYNALGVREDKWGKSDLKDVSYDPFGTAYTDTRLLIAKPISNNYPYSVEYIYEYELNHSFFTNKWKPGWQHNLSVEHSSFKLTHPKGYKYQYKESDPEASIEKTEIEDGVIWEIKNYKATKPEPLSPVKSLYKPMVTVTPIQFNYDEYNGNFLSWKEFGDFIKQLNKGRDALHPDDVKAITLIMDSKIDTLEIIQALYEYMQNKTRYISIQVGIGSWQPFHAQKVGEDGFGDCKALSNYMKSILNFAGIRSHYSLINAGKYNYYFDTAYVRNNFNHTILCVPVKEDTLWLECTSQTIPFGYVGSFIDNRYTLLITKNGGKLAKTPSYNANQNLISRKIEAKLDQDGNCSTSVSSSYHGLNYSSKHHLGQEDKEEQLKMLYKSFDIPNFNIHNFTINTEGTINPVLTEDIDMELISYASKTGDRLFLPINPVSQMSYVPSKLTERCFDIHKKFAASYIDTVNFHLPDNYKIESLPTIREIENQYGAYSAKIIENDNQLTYIRSVQINSGIFPANEYNDYRDFFKNIKRNDDLRVVLVKN